MGEKGFSERFFPSCDIVLAWKVAYSIIIFLDGDPFYADDPFDEKVKSNFMLMKVSKTDGCRWKIRSRLRCIYLLTPGPSALCTLLA